MNSKKMVLFMILFLVILFVGASFIPNDSESEPQDFCDTILSFDEDVDDICAQKFEKEIREACSIHESQITEEQCLSEVTLLLIEDCVNTKETLAIDPNVCLYKKMNNFKDDLERWLQ